MRTIRAALTLWIATACACSDNLSENALSYAEQTANAVLTVEEAQQQFAEILSKAVYNHAELRTFLKTQALKQFDNDYDVFYPLVKDEQVGDLGTFREVLLDYIPEADLCTIETKLPLLNIYVPNLSLFVDVTPENWDTADKDIPVAVKNQDETNTLMYLNGEYVDKMAGDEIPDFHFLYIKNNERVRKTRSRSINGMNGYEFISEVFDGTRPKPQAASRAVQSRATSPAYDIDWVPASKIDPVVISAWKTMKSDPSLQRDNIYYGMTPTQTEGIFNSSIDEYIYRFQIDPAAYYSITDPNETIHKLWSDGYFEIHIQAFTGKKNRKELTENQYTLNIRPADLFDATTTEWQKRRAEFGKSDYYCKIDPDKLERKWVYPCDLGYGLRLPKWDLSTQPIERDFTISELDAGETYETTESYPTTYIRNFKSEGGWNVKVGLGYDAIASAPTSSSVKITKSKTSNQLGTLLFYFYDSIIIEENPSKGYRPKNVSNGTVTMTLMPMSKTFSHIN